MRPPQRYNCRGSGTWTRGGGERISQRRQRCQWGDALKREYLGWEAEVAPAPLRVPSHVADDACCITGVRNLPRAATKRSADDVLHTCHVQLHDKKHTLCVPRGAESLHLSEGVSWKWGVIVEDVSTLCAGPHSTVVLPCDRAIPLRHVVLGMGCLGSEEAESRHSRRIAVSHFAAYDEHICFQDATFYHPHLASRDVGPILAVCSHRYRLVGNGCE